MVAIVLKSAHVQSKHENTKRDKGWESVLQHNVK